MVIKAWVNDSDEEYQTERVAYSVLSVLPMKGYPSLIGIIPPVAPTQGTCLGCLVLEKLGPSLQDLCDLMPNMRFDEKMTLALAIQMVRDFFSPLVHESLNSSCFFDYQA